jgi:hypothetical protein
MKTKLTKQCAAVLIAAALSGTAWSLPFLQLDIVEPHHYDSVTETIIADHNPFSVRALIDAYGGDLDRTYYLSAAITPKADLGSSFGSFLLEGAQYDAGNMEFGTPPVDEALRDIAPHDIFPTYFTELAFQLVLDQMVPAYNTQDGEQVSGATLYYVDFLTNVGALLAANSVHFDLYTYDEKGEKVDAFAPFSHDAQSGTHGIIVNKVPDGGTTLILLGLGLGGLGYLRRKLA